MKVKIIGLALFLGMISLLSNAQKNLKTENVILITLDGFRWQEVFTGADETLIGDEDYVENTEHLKSLFWRNDFLSRREVLLPFFWNTLAKEGQIYGNRKFGSEVDVTNGLFFSYPGYNEILVGYKDDRVDSNDKINNRNKTVLEFVNEQEGFEGKVAAFGSWDVFPYIINEERSGVPVNAGFESQTGDLSEKEIFLNELQSQIPSPWSTVRLDAFTHHYAKEYLERKAPRLLYIAYGETDDFAHGGLYDAYLKSGHQTDAFIKDLWEWTKTKEQYKDKTTIVITSDHGRGTVPKDSWRGHGSDTKGAHEIWFAVIGPDTEGIGEIKSKGKYYQNQIAKTVASFLGLEYKNKQKVGPAIKEVFND